MHEIDINRLESIQKGNPSTVYVLSEKKRTGDTLVQAYHPTRSVTHLAERIHHLFLMSASWVLSVSLDNLKMIRFSMFLISCV